MNLLLAPIRNTYRGYTYLFFERAMQHRRSVGKPCLACNAIKSVLNVDRGRVAIGNARNVYKSYTPSTNMERPVPKRTLPEKFGVEFMPRRRWKRLLRNFLPIVR